jgi:cardiolipin synthase
MKVIFVLLVILCDITLFRVKNGLIRLFFVRRPAKQHIKQHKCDQYAVFDPKKSDITLIHCGSELVRQMTADIRQAVSSIHHSFSGQKRAHTPVFCTPPGQAAYQAA